jgi:hypothetical protein
MSNLHNEIGSLSAAEKFELLDGLWESLEADAPARRSRTNSGPNSTIAWPNMSGTRPM